jgi:hypothetical protein
VHSSFGRLLRTTIFWCRIAENVEDKDVHRVVGYHSAFSRLFFRLEPYRLTNITLDATRRCMSTFSRSIAIFRKAPLKLEPWCPIHMSMTHGNAEVAWGWGLLSNEAFVFSAALFRVNTSIGSWCGIGASAQPSLGRHIIALLIVCDVSSHEMVRDLTTGQTKG